MTLPVPSLDHVVINARDEMDAAAAVYRRLGFRLTPRGYHSLGSTNHLAMFATDYLELIAVPKGATTGRLELLQWPAGLNGLVFGTEDSAAVHASLTASGIAAEPPLEFTRPVEFSGGKRDARFRTVRLKPGVAPEGRVYFCHHFTRDLVWRDEWRHHPNGAIAVARLVIAADQPEAAAAVYAGMFGAEALKPIEGGRSLAVGAARVDIVTPAALKQQFGDACPEAHGRSSYMAALGIRTRSLEHAARVMAADGIACRREGGRLLVPAAEAVNTALEFVE